MNVSGGLKRHLERYDLAMLRRVIANLTVALAALGRAPRADARRLMRWSRGRIASIAALSIAVIVCAIIFFDADAITGARRLPRLIVWSFDQVTDFGKSGWFLWPLGILLIAIAAAPPSLPRPAMQLLAAIAARAGFLFVAIGAPSLFVTILKRLIGRARPFVGGAADPYLFSPFIWRADYASLPSGHATTAFAAAVAIGILWPRARMLLWSYAVIIAVSRVVVSAHHPSDVIAGAVVGIFGALLVRDYFAYRRLVFGIAADATVRPRTGPSLRRIKKVARTLLA